MGKLTGIERKGICLGLFWGIISPASWGRSTFWTRCLQAPYFMGQWLGRLGGFAGSERTAYVLAVLSGAGMAYLAALIIWRWRLRRSVSRRRNASRRRYRKRRYGAWSGK